MKGTKRLSPSEFYSNSQVSSLEEPQRISLQMFNRIVEKLTNADIQDSTKRVYHSIWCNFNKFLLCFDDLPTTWEQKLVLYATFLADAGCASATVASYMSAIRYVLRHDNVEISNTSCKLASIIKACKLHNDTVTVRRPIRGGLLKLILKQVDQEFMLKGQPYLSAVYKAIIVSGYYGLMRASELVGRHAVVAEDVHISENHNKRKVKMILRSSKTHHRGKRPQTIEIVPDDEVVGTAWCPYNILSAYSLLRPKRHVTGNHFFVFSDGSKITERHVRTVLRRAIKNLNLPPNAYNLHGLRSGRATELYRRNYPVEWIRKAGRWSVSSSSVCKYFY